MPLHAIAALNGLSGSSRSKVGSMIARPNVLGGSGDSHGNAEDETNRNDIRGREEKCKTRAWHELELSRSNVMTIASGSQKMQVNVLRFGSALIRKMQGDFIMLLQAESDLDTECKRLRKAVKRARRSDRANFRIAAELEIVLRDIAKYRSRVNTLLERIDFVGFDGSLCVGEVQELRRMMREELKPREVVNRA
jgi:hypothetical protein